MAATAETGTEVRQQSPDGLITGTLTGRNRFRFHVRGGFTLHSDTELGRQLSALTTGLLTEYVECRERHYDALGVQLITTPSMAVHERHREYLRDVAALRVGVVSRRELLRVRTIGWRKLRYDVAAGAIASVSAEELLADLHAATARLAAEFAAASARRHHAIYGPPRPRTQRAR